MDVPTRRLAARIAVALAVPALLASCSSSTNTTTSTGTPRASGSALSSAPPAGSAPVSVQALQDAFTHVAAAVLPQVVQIKTDSGLGSGIVFDAGGDIVTNAHVVANSSSFQVTLSTGKTYSATLVGSFTPDDLAVVKLQSPPPDLKVATFADSSKLQVGDLVMAVGNPLGLQSSVTEGIVSATGRTVSEGNGVTIPDAIQTSAAINPGNSGGALVDCSGDLVGVPSAGATVPNESGEASGGSIGLGFAIPVDAAKTISDEIIATGHVTHSYFGLQTVPIPAAAAAQSGLPEGLFVAGTPAGGPAQQAGIRPGDVITTIEGQPATSNVQLQELTLTKKPGETVELGYTRDGRSATATVTLAAQP
jgi:S1-C subfamily serine protease